MIWQHKLSVWLTDKEMEISLYHRIAFGYSYTVPICKLQDSRVKAVTADDFRGIAISPVISKVFEHCVLDKLCHFLSTADNQFGFKKGLSCNHAIYTVRSVVEHFNNGRSRPTVNLCAIDLSSKAFDKINHCTF